MFSKVDSATAKKMREMYEAGVKKKEAEEEEKRREAARKKAAADKQSQLLASLKRPHDDEDSKLLRKRVRANASSSENPRFTSHSISQMKTVDDSLTSLTSLYRTNEAAMTQQTTALKQQATALQGIEGQLRETNANLKEVLDLHKAL